MTIFSMTVWFAIEVTGGRAGLGLEQLSILIGAVLWRKKIVSVCANPGMFTSPTFQHFDHFLSEPDASNRFSKAEENFSSFHC